MYVLPSLFTTANMALGYYAIAQAIAGSRSDIWHFNQAAIAIGLAILFDGLDGTVARLTNTTSEFGKQLDSLADVITFGVAPALLAWLWGVRLLPPMDDVEVRTLILRAGAVASFLFITAGASRLARFNIQLNPQPSNPGRPGHKYFVGMPIPAAAAVIAATVHFNRGLPLNAWWMAVVWVALVVALSFLMVSTWRFWKPPDVWRTRVPFWVMVLLASLIGGIVWASEYVLFFLALTYTLSGVLARLGFILRRPAHRPAEVAQTQ
jgi:CDP-diacylglycerol--serine O-phosphatidyltransferase